MRKLTRLEQLEYLIEFLKFQRDYYQGELDKAKEEYKVLKIEKRK